MNFVKILILSLSTSAIVLSMEDAQAQPTADIKAIANVVKTVDRHAASTDRVKVYPNPFSKQVTFEFENKKADKFNILLYDMIGNLVYRENNIIGERISINRRDMKPGIYIYKLRSGEKVLACGKIILQPDKES